MGYVNVRRTEPSSQGMFPIRLFYFNLNTIWVNNKYQNVLMNFIADIISSLVSYSYERHHNPKS